MEQRFDLIVVGGGPGGYTAAIKAAKLGLRTALIEKRKLGGTCLNRGCIPTKVMLHTAGLFRQIKRSEQFGILVPEAAVDYRKLLEYKQNIIAQLVHGIEQLLKANGVAYVQGRGTLLPGKQVRVVSETSEAVMSADNVLLAAGSKPRMLSSLAGMNLSGVLDSDKIFALEELPESLIIIGGGAIGVEFAEIFSGLGSQIIILEAQPDLLPNVDREISRNLRMILKKRGIEIHTGAKLLGVTPENGSLTCAFLEKEKETFVSAQYVLCAVGRQPDTGGLFGNGAEPRMERGYVAVDETYQSNLEGVYAIGDMIKGAQLAHAASAQGIVVAEHLAGKTPSVDTKVIPRCVYTDPEIAAVGISEEEAKSQGIQIRVGKFLMGANGKSLISGKERGYIKIISSAQTGRVIGAQMMCGRATDMIGELTTAVSNGLTAGQLLRAIRPHPTYGEGVGEALEELAGGAIHAIPRA